MAMCDACKRLQVKLGERELQIAQLEREISIDRAFSGTLMWLAIIIFVLGLWFWRNVDLVSLLNQPRAQTPSAEVTPPPAQHPPQAPGAKKKGR